MANNYYKRPRVVVPQVQIDTWSSRASTSIGFDGSKKSKYSASDIAKELFLNNTGLIGKSLLKSKSATTIVEIARCVKVAHAPIAPYISSGQIYMCTDWRVRYSDMNITLQAMVEESAQVSSSDLLHEFKIYYNADKVTAAIYSIIGPARSAGVQSVLPLVDYVVE